MKANVGTEQKPIFVDFLEDKKQIEMEKGINLTDTETLENISEIIGYTNENEIPRIWGGNITNKNKKGQDLLISDELYLREILKQEAEVIQSNAQDVSTFSSTRRDRSATKTSTAYYASGPAGTLTSFYKLYQSLDESDSDTDLFTVENTVQVVANSGWRATVLNMENSLPWSSDNMDAYNPKDDSSSPYSVTFGFPINLNFTFYHSDNPNINSSGSFSNDWARWYVTDYNMSDDSYFTPGMSWTSYGTLATADLDYSATFRSGIDVSTSTSQHWDIYYDYQ